MVEHHTDRGRTSAAWMLLLGSGLWSACLGDPGGLGGSGATGTGGTSADSGPAAATDGVDGSDTGVSSATAGGDGVDPPPPGPPGGDACPQLGCLPCGQGRGCAPGEPLVEGTCCAQGDPLVRRGIGGGSEIVDIEVQGSLSITCGGFGASIEDVTDPTHPMILNLASPRCQHIAFGPLTPDGGQVFYLAHHGDTWVDTPFLGTYRLDGDFLTELQVEGDPQVLFEGLTWRDGWLYVAAHGGGLRVYSTDALGVPTLANVVDGFDNALRTTVAGEYLYVADGVGGLEVLSLADPALPTPVATLPLPGMVRDVVVDGDEAFLAKGGDGIDIIDITDPGAPMVAGHIETRGTAQAVAVDQDIVAIAAWSHVAVHDRETGQLLATERVDGSPSFEQDLAIAMANGMIYVGEWERMYVLEHRPGLVSADIWLEQDLLSFPFAEPADAVVVVRNRGYLDLLVDPIEALPPFAADERWVQVPPQSGRAFEVNFTPPAPEGGSSVLRLHSNDPDDTQQPVTLPLIARDSSGLDVGDTLTSDFAFLDPGGSPELAGLQGQVIVLAYFALF